MLYVWCATSSHILPLYKYLGMLEQHSSVWQSGLCMLCPCCVCGTMCVFMHIKVQGYNTQHCAINDSKGYSCLLWMDARWLWQIIYQLLAANRQHLTATVVFSFAQGPIII